jgi:kynurenine 3-monooxygenase
MTKTESSSTTASLLEIIVIGAGASGLASAILLARDHGARVVVYERQLSVAQSDEESYPIGVNPRGMRTLRLIDPAMQVSYGSVAEKIQGWSIRDGAREIALLPSGTVLGTTRGKVISELMQVAQATRGIKFEMGMELRSVDLASDTLTFARRRHGTGELLGGRGGGSLWGSAVATPPRHA